MPAVAELTVQREALKVEEQQLNEQTAESEKRIYFLVEDARGDKYKCKSVGFSVVTGWQDPPTNDRDELVKMAESTMAVDSRIDGYEIVEVLVSKRRSKTAEEK